LIISCLILPDFFSAWAAVLYPVPSYLLKKLYTILTLIKNFFLRLNPLGDALSPRNFRNTSKKGDEYRKDSLVSQCKKVFSDHIESISCSSHDPPAFKMSNYAALPRKVRQTPGDTYLWVYDGLPTGKCHGGKVEFRRQWD